MSAILSLPSHSFSSRQKITGVNQINSRNVPATNLRITTTPEEFEEWPQTRTDERTRGYCEIWLWTANEEEWSVRREKGEQKANRLYDLGLSLKEDEEEKKEKERRRTENQNNEYK